MDKLIYPELPQRTHHIDALALQSSPAERKVAASPQFTPLFDGKSLAHWRGDRTVWSVVDGTITGQSTVPIKENTYLIHEGEFQNFELRLKYRFLSSHGNSGLQYRSRAYPAHAFSVAGYQANFVAPDAYGSKELFSTFYGMLYDQEARGVLAKFGEQVEIREHPNGNYRKVTGSLNDSLEVLAALQPYPAWNDYVVIAYDHHVVHVANGFLIADVLDQDVNGRAIAGFFALQLHAGPPMGVQVKDIEVKVLTAEPEIIGRFTVRRAGQAAISWPRVGDAASAAEGQRIYEQRCAMCHSSSQPGIPPRNALCSLSPDAMMINGIVPSHPFGLSTSEIEALAVYLTASPKAP